MLGALIRACPDIGSLLENRLAETTSLLERYVKEIELFNAAYGLVSVRGRQELITRHILDSLAPLGILSRVLDKTGTSPLAADVGSGAGLPGIPLAIALPEISFTLIERMGRRAGFLRNTEAVLGLKNITIEENEMEKARPGPYHLITVRAFRPLEPPIVKGLFRLLAPDGVVAAYKGKKEKAEAEMEALGIKDWELKPCPVPGLDEERNLVLLHKNPCEKGNQDIK